MKIKDRLRRALVGGRTWSAKVAGELEERGLARIARMTETGIGPEIELQPTNDGRALARLYASQGVEPEQPPALSPSHGLRGLVVLQPWAAAVAMLGKGWENRGRRMARFAARSLVGQRFALIEGKGVSEDAPGEPPVGAAWAPPVAPGHVILTARVGRVVGPGQVLEDPWRIEGQYGIELLDKHVLPEPVPCKPRQGWTWLTFSQSDVAREVERQDARWLKIALDG